MSHKSFVSAAIAGLFLLSFSGRKIYAQAEISKLEAGVQISVLRHNGSAYSFAFLDPQSGPDLTDVGVGGRIAYYVTRNVSFEVEVNFFPRELPTSQSRTQGLFGMKAGRRFNKVGVFGKVRPGFVSFSKGRLPDPLVPGGGLFITFPGKTVFALDLGGVIEIYHSRHFFSRLDFGNTSIRTTDQVAVNGGSFKAVGVTKSNFQFSAGMGFRF